jgi:hypothetical protein
MKEIRTARENTISERLHNSKYRGMRSLLGSFSWTLACHISSRIEPVRHSQFYNAHVKRWGRFDEVKSNEAAKRVLASVEHSREGLGAQTLAVHNEIVWTLSGGASRTRPRNAISAQLRGTSSHLRISFILLERARMHARGKGLSFSDSGFFDTKGRHVTLVGATLRLFLRLVKERLEHPGYPLASLALFEFSWPDERVLPHAANIRVRVAVAKLRSLGLSDIIANRGGYFLRPEWPLRELIAEGSSLPRI